jgi:hypothetical protein
VGAASGEGCKQTGCCCCCSPLADSLQAGSPWLPAAAVALLALVYLSLPQLLLLCVLRCSGNCLFLCCGCPTCQDPGSERVTRACCCLKGPCCHCCLAG